MKNGFYFLIILPLMAWSQSPAEPSAEARQKIEAARIAFITERLGLTPEEAERFWPVYREFSEKRNNLRRQLEEARSSAPSGPGNEEAQKRLLDLELQIKQRELDLEKEYSGRLLNTISPQKLLALRQAEQDFRNMVLRQIQQRQLQQQRMQRLQERNNQRLRQRNN
jgi:hypothetical protein